MPPCQGGLLWDRAASVSIDSRGCLRRLAVDSFSMRTRSSRCGLARLSRLDPPGSTSEAPDQLGSRTTRSAINAHRFRWGFLLSRLAWTATVGVGVAIGQQAPLTLDDCQRLALAAPSTLTLARQDREVAARGITQARAGLLPYAQVNSGFN